MKYQEDFKKWMTDPYFDDDIKNELSSINQQKEIEERFYKNLDFGTGGLRGLIGAGTNRMNRYTVAKATQGIANYLNKNNDKQLKKVAISFDSRIKSDEFAKVTAQVFAANNIYVYIYSELMPTPCLSFAVRQLNCDAGVMITASHNPAEYNGYKVYDADGCQITLNLAEKILTEIEKVIIEKDIRKVNFNEALNNGFIKYIEPKIYDDFVDEVKKQSLLGEDNIDKNVAIIYTPLNGTGLKPVLRTLREAGYCNITVVKEQENPDGNFPTCPYPNPEIREAMELGIEYAEKNNAELLLATDPDCDRVGIAVKYGEEYRLLTGNETGLLLLDYVCNRRQKLGKMPKNPVFIKTIVTTNMAQRIANYYGVKTINVPVGFKFIGEQIGYLEKGLKQGEYIFGFEESYGYLTGTYVRDKDGVNGAFMICEMFAYYKAQNKSLIDKLNELYEIYGYCLNRLHTFVFEGIEGNKKMDDIMRRLRNGIKEIGEKAVNNMIDYQLGIEDLPKINMIKYELEGNSVVTVRPSGTEPKMKVYISVSAKNELKAKDLAEKIRLDLEKYLK